MIEVDEHEIYGILKINYDGDVLEADVKVGNDISYKKLYVVKEWDILFSNMGVGRGAIGIVPKYFDGRYVSNEFTIIRAKTKARARISFHTPDFLCSLNLYLS